MTRWAAAIAAIGGLAGAAGVALAAYATHSGGDPNRMTAAQFLLFHAPALLMLGLVAPARRGLLAGASALALGVVLFSAALCGYRAFPMAAPTGGLMMIGGWIALAGAGAWTRLSRRPPDQAC